MNRRVEWAPSLPCLPLHPVTASESLRGEGREPSLSWACTTHLMPGPWCPWWGKGGGHRNLAEAICPGKGTLQEAVERPGARGELG